MVATTRRIDAIIDQSPALATVSIEFPKSPPNPAVDGGKFVRGTSNPILNFDAASEDKIIMSCMIEDPARDRVLALVHTRTTAVTLNNGRQVYLYSCPWGADLLTPGNWTRLNANASPLIARGAAGDWDAGDVYAASGTILGNTLYLAYIGNVPNDVDSPNNTVGLGHSRIGLATADLGLPSAPVAAPTAVKLTTGAVAGSPWLHLGLGTPWQATAPQLFNLNGTFYLWVNCNVSVNPIVMPAAPRLYTSNFFSTTVGAGGWTIDPRMKEYGNIADTGAGAAYYNDQWRRMKPLDGAGRRWMYIQAGVAGSANDGSREIFQLDLRDDNSIQVSELASILSATGAQAWEAAGLAYSDGFVPFWHLGDWYLFWKSQAAGPGAFAVGGAKYSTINGQESQTGFTASSKNHARELIIDLSASGYPSPTAIADGAVYGVGYDFSVRGKVSINGTQYDTLANPGYIFIDHVGVEAPGGGGYLRSATSTASYPKSAGKFMLANRYPTAPHSHTENTAAAYTQNAVTADNAAAVGLYVAAGGNGGQPTLRIIGKSI